ncbi:ABC transporter substrate-binding protein [Phreatobacter aquaticus]|uniref:ABC transporter substrate-binding protein n=1 Tax=Phreatobacter aquaticus TaxID=2570229 RepID=A0A4D7QGR1_9HYPH|nr:ABC transporter substrate-binding protein [Phreatobacter aquaticus]QCK84636.1 ABC transporter substrate-binding protein [Phreatobacter aquaticus]
MTKLKLWTAALIAAGTVFAATPPVHAQQSVLRIGLAEDPDVLDPTRGRTYVGRIVFASICDKLFDIDDKLAIVPQLALSHETSADGLTVTIKLRPNVKFHDGEVMDAEAVKFSLERHLTMQGSFRRPELSAIDKVEVVDPLTVRLVLKQPFSPLLSQLTDRAGMMVSPKAARELGERFGSAPVCAGPYRFVERIQQDRIVVERFADYWNKDQVTINRIEYRPIADATVRLANLRSGQLDMIERALSTDIPQIQANPQLRLTTSIDLGYQGITLNTAKSDAAKTAFGQDPRVIQAFSLAIDRQAINQVVFNGSAMPGNQWVNPTNPFYQTRFPVPQRDVAKARQLLQAAGVRTPVVVDFMVPNNPEVRQVAEVLQAMTAEAGFELKIRVTEFATSLQEAEQGRYQAYMLNWSGRTDPDGNAFSFHACRQPLNYAGYCNATVDALLAEARTKTSLADRKAIYEKVTEILQAEGGIVYLYHRPVVIAHTARLEGFRPMPDGLARVVGLKFRGN